MTKYTIYTDGACLNNGTSKAKAGFGAVLTNPQGKRLEIAGPVPADQQQTNSRAELMAIVEALKRCTKVAPITVFTDSKYIADACNEWLDGWKQRGWKKADGKPPSHSDLWEEVDQQLQTKGVTVVWVRGHSGIIGNEQADALAGLGAQGKTVNRLRTKA
ncbi:ribonuclease HI/ribonuclease HI / DNA polymerase-3 subunit epsilon [Atopomonas hussainii]|uniref:ribonuclease H n=1 Tax=Atopomonas hussainii TaxID=1429083 RepID=A0A1H7SPZ4_9GAMM|nr:ribonuclease H [Atopomonas hussainii]SEL74469.1 ribonuclease HI/ribonuclease HI / DNA polymerase-3 subunit epsilon [Atopomonas hussainii]